MNFGHKPMGRHTKLALFIAPFLMLAGYIASDYWVAYQADKPSLYHLTQTGSCDVINKICRLNAGELEITVYDVDGVTSVKSTAALERVVLFLVGDDGQGTPYLLSADKDPRVWQAKTPLREQMVSLATKQLRLIASVKGTSYIAEFEARSAGKE